MIETYYTITPSMEIDGWILLVISKAGTTKSIKVG